jgi:hypothetical protein
MPGFHPNLGDGIAAVDLPVSAAATSFALAIVCAIK